MAQFSDFLSDEVKAELAQILEAAKKEPEWFAETHVRLMRELPESEVLPELLRAWERKMSRKRVEEAKRSENERRHNSLVKKHKNWTHLIDPERGE